MRHFGYVGFLGLFSSAILAACGGGGGTGKSAMPPTLIRADLPLSTATPLNPNYSYFTLHVPGIRITSLRTTIKVPPKPPAFGFISLWPGLDNNEAISVGKNILQQPILQWGGVCTDRSLPRYASWLAEAFYYSESQYRRGQTGCNGGTVISVEPSDNLTESIVLTGTGWRQTITDTRTGRSSRFDYSVKELTRHYPDRVNFDIEIWNTNGFNNHLPAVTFTNTRIIASTAFPTCVLTSYVSPPSNSTTGPNSTSKPIRSNGGKTCSYARITLYPVRRFIQPPGIDLKDLTDKLPVR